MNSTLYISFRIEITALLLGVLLLDCSQGTVIMKTLTLTLFSALSLLSLQANAENCSFIPGHSQTILNIDIPATLSIPRDTPNGTVIYESTPITLGDVSAFKCTTESLYGIENDVGVTNSGSEMLPIMNTGLAWQWGRGEGIIAYTYPNGVRKAAASIKWAGTIHRLLLVKVADIYGVQKVPSGILGRSQADGISPLAMSTSGTTILPQSCEAPNIAVQMGIYTQSELGDVQGGTTEPVAFGIKLNNCPAGINKITYAFTRVGETYDYRNGVIRLNTSSTAKGVGLQIKRSDGAPVPIDGTTKQVFDAYDSKGGNFVIPMTAAYYRITNDGNFHPGTANAELIFTIEYQ